MNFFIHKFPARDCTRTTKDIYEKQLNKQDHATVSSYAMLHRLEKLFQARYSTLPHCVQPRLGGAVSKCRVKEAVAHCGKFSNKIQSMG